VISCSGTCLKAGSGCTWPGRSLNPDRILGETLIVFNPVTAVIRKNVLRILKLFAIFILCCLANLSGTCFRECFQSSLQVPLRAFPLSPLTISSIFIAIQAITVFVFQFMAGNG